MREIVLERVVKFLKLSVLFRAARKLEFQFAIELSKLLVHRERRRLKRVIAGEQLVAMAGILDCDEQFLAKPGLDDESVDLTAVDRFDDRIEAQHRRDQHSR